MAPATTTAYGRRIDTPELFAEEFSVSRETVSRLKTYEDLLKRWQKTINLVAPGTVADVWHRHFSDSAQLWRLAESPTGVWLDFGSGAGFPGLVLAIMAAEKAATRHILIESDSRKAAFLREVVRHTGVAVDILCTRIESTETLAKVETASCVTARALAPLPRLAGLVAPYFELSTRGLFLKGREVAAELEAARRDWDFEYSLVPSLTETGARIVVLHGLRAKNSRITT